MRDAFSWELRQRLADLETDRTDEALMHGLPETGDHTPLVLECNAHGRYIPMSLVDQWCPMCEAEYQEFYRSRPLPPVRWGD